MRLLHPEQRVTMAVAKSRALGALRPDTPTPASAVASAIWPGHDMTGQGAGGAASRILRRLQDEGRARWTAVGRRGCQTWGWVKT